MLTAISGDPRPRPLWSGALERPWLPRPEWWPRDPVAEGRDHDLATSTRGTARHQAAPELRPEPLGHAASPGTQAPTAGTVTWGRHRPAHDHATPNVPTASELGHQAASGWVGEIPSSETITKLKHNLIYSFINTVVFTGIIQT